MHKITLVDIHWGLALGEALLWVHWILPWTLWVRDTVLWLLKTGHLGLRQKLITGYSSGSLAMCKMTPESGGWWCMVGGTWRPQDIPFPQHLYQDNQDAFNKMPPAQSTSFNGWWTAVWFGGFTAALLHPDLLMTLLSQELGPGRNPDPEKS